MKLELFRILSDRAIALQYALKTLHGCPTIDDLVRVTGKSSASIYRALAELSDAGLHPTLSHCERQKPKRRRYCAAKGERNE